MCRIGVSPNDHSAVPSRIRARNEPCEPFVPRESCEPFVPREPCGFAFDREFSFERELECKCEGEGKCESALTRHPSSDNPANHARSSSRVTLHAIAQASNSLDKS